MTYFPERTIQYKTFVKQTMGRALHDVFQNHPDKLLASTRVSVEYPREQVDYPTVIIRFFERDISNAGIANEEQLVTVGQTKGSSVVEIVANGGAQITWGSVEGATRYRVWRAQDGPFTQYIETTQTRFIDDGLRNWVTDADFPTVNSAPFDNPQDPEIIASPGGALVGDWRYCITALAPSQVWKYQHYLYTGDIEFAVYALSSVDRDLISDTVVQTLAMGTLEDYTNRFFAKVYGDNQAINNAHVLNFNSDLIQGFGENQANVSWGEEDSMVYTTAYRVKVLGEFYSLPPEIPYELVEKIFFYPYIAGVEDVPTGDTSSDSPWE
jgi:hypothetical protein